MTATISNKSVLKLAQTKGYIPTDYTLNENGFHGYLSEDQYYLEMCFIQKWLRDTHKIHIEIQLNASKLYNATVCSFGWKGDKELNFYSYESALLYGINEALQLI